MFDLSGALEDNVVRIMTILAILSGGKKNPYEASQKFFVKIGQWDQSTSFL